MDAWGSFVRCVHSWTSRRFFFPVFLERLHDTTSVPFGFAHDGALGRTRMLGSCLF